MCTMMAGVMLVLLGVTGTGSAVKFIPRPVIIGFTNGIAILIASTQIRDFLGLQVSENTGEFLPRMAALARASRHHFAGGGRGRRGLARDHHRRQPVRARRPGNDRRARRRAPPPCGCSACRSRPSARDLAACRPVCPPPRPAVRTRADSQALSPAVTVAMLGAIESLMSAVVADRMSGDRHNPNVELVAQGVANIVSPIFGGLPATGAIARTATNIRSGARTPVAGMVHAITLADRPARGRAARRPHPDGRARRDSVRRGLADGRMGGDSGAASSRPGRTSRSGSPRSR